MRESNLDETMPHRKIKPSNTSKSSKKSKHKHEYEYVLYHYIGTFDRYYVRRRCIICGKMAYNDDFDKFPMTERLNDGRAYSRMLSNEEIYERYKDLPQVEGDKLIL